MNGFKDKELRFKILEEIFEKPKYIIFLENPQKLFILIISKDYGGYIYLKISYSIPQKI